MSFLNSLVIALRKLFTPFPHLPQSVLALFLPFLSWYVFLRGLFKIIDGLRQISSGLHYSSLPRIFTSLVDVQPFYLFIAAALSLAAGVLYLKSYPALAEPARRKAGWNHWAVAAALLTLAQIYETLILSKSITWLVISAMIGWYLIFEFERIIAKPTASKKRTRK